jgi:serine/threonine protein kinase
VVEQALDSGDGADRVIQESFAGDLELQEMARSLVDQSQETAIALESPCPGAAAAMVSTLAASELLGRRFGPYRAIGLIGEGAMGTVYLAVRADESFERQVAVKVLRGTLGDAESRRRFDQERRLLARLEHAGICRLLDGGSTEDGLAYIVMEHVDGEPLSQWAKSRTLGAEGGGTHARHERRARVELFARVCEAVACAHRAGVVHRDLKPTNILVTRVKGAGGAPQPKIIDFGIARVIDSDLTTCISSESRLLGTLPYMAPEQIAGSASGASARADVYSLGVILYELLAGRPPLDVQTTGVPEALRRIKEEEPTRLGALDRSLRGDLETIVAKAMEKDPRRRYASADELAADLQRWLADQPIVARRPSTAYQASKFIRRHRALVGGAAIIFVALSTAVVAVSTALVRVARQGERMREVNGFMRGLLASADPFSVPAGPRAVGNGGAPAIQAADMLGAAEAWLANHPIDDPLVEADIRDALGVSCSGLGRHEAAVPQLEAALRLRTDHLGADAVPTLESMSHLATALSRTDDLARADALHRSAIAGLEHALGPSDLLVLRAQFELIMCLIHENRFDQAAELAGRVEQAARARGTDGQTLGALAEGLRAVSLVYSSDDTEGERLAEAALSDIERTCGADHYVAALVTCTLGGVAESRGDLAQAERRYRAAAASYTRLLGEHDPRTASRLVSLGRVLDGQGRFAEAQDPLRRALAGGSVDSPVARQVAEQARAELAVCLRGLGQDADAVVPVGTTSK